MTERNDAEALATAKDLSATMKTVVAEIARLRQFGRRNRKFIWFDIALTFLLAAVSGIAFYAVQSAHDANVSAAAARAVAGVAQQNNRALCLSSNIARAQQVDLWDYIIGLNKVRPQTAQQQENTARFETHLHVLFAPRNFAHLNSKTP